MYDETAVSNSIVSVLASISHSSSSNSLFRGVFGDPLSLKDIWKCVWEECGWCHPGGQYKASVICRQSVSLPLQHSLECLY